MIFHLDSCLDGRFSKAVSHVSNCPAARMYTLLPFFVTFEKEGLDSSCCDLDRATFCNRPFEIMSRNNLVERNDTEEVMRLKKASYTALPSQP